MQNWIRKYSKVGFSRALPKGYRGRGIETKRKILFSFGNNESYIRYKNLNRKGTL